ncbi:MAG TPA: hypothetical protein VNQ77_16440 [Frankiaceae bacterium]|nr:hypothetical protein [Frankiaceae bacterium]
MTRRLAALALLVASAATGAAAAEPWLCVDVPGQQVLHVHVRPMELCFLAPEG